MRKIAYVIPIFATIIAGFLLGRVSGSASSSLQILPGVHRDFPLFPTPPKSDEVPAQPLQPEKDIVVESPLDGERPRDLTFEVAGRAKVGGSDIEVTVIDDTGAKIFEQRVTPIATAGEPYGRFAVPITFATMPSAAVTLSVRRVDAKDQVGDIRKLAYGGADDVPINVYFSASNSDNGCGIVYPQSRLVPANVAVYRAAIEELLKGPNADDVSLARTTAIPVDVTLKSVGANADGVVSADFSEKLVRGISDVCRLETIRAQIGATLRQFPEARDVVITVGGEADVFGTSKD